MKKIAIIFGMLVFLALPGQRLVAGTLDRGVHIDAFFVVCGSTSNPYVAQLKYQMAVDTKVGLENRYTSVANSYNTYTYENSSFDTHNTGTFNTFDTALSGGSGDVVINNTF